METPTARETDVRRSPLIRGLGGAAQRLWSVYGGYALGFVSLFLIWQLASLYVVSSVLFPPPTVVFTKGLLLVRNGVLLEDSTISMFRLAEAQLKQQGKLSKPLDYGAFVYPDLLRKVQPMKVNYKP